jgi:hypothetical protein
VKKRNMLILFVCLMESVQSQLTYDPAVSPCLEAVSCTPGFTNALSCVVNPAALTLLKGFSAALYMEKKYLIEGLNLAELSIVYGRKSGGAGICLKYFGNADYHEIHTAVNYGKNLGNIKLGASLKYSEYSITGFNKASLFYLGFYSIFKLSDKVYTALQLVNPPFSRFSGPALRQVSFYRIAFYYEASPAACLSLELQKKQNSSLAANGSVQFHLGKKISGKAGFFTAGPQPYIQLGWLMDKFRIDFSICYHPALGTTPGLLFMLEKSGGEALQ